MPTHSLDLAVSDVHVDSVGGKKRKMATPKRRPKLRAAKPSKVRVRADIALGGSLHVRHCTDAKGELVLLGGVEMAATVASDPVRPVWIQLAKPGSFKGHSAGPFTLDAHVFEQVLANFASTKNKHIPIDFNHASEQDPTTGTLPTEGAPAQGWIVDMKIDGGNLWGLVQWGTLARQYIREGGYRYFSPAIRFNSRDRVTGQPVGARMSSGALTNDPFLDGLMPVAASRTLGDAVALAAISRPYETLPGIRRALSLSEMASATECSDEFSRLRDAVDAGDGDDIHGMPVRSRLSSLRDEMRAPHTQDRGEFLDQVQEIIDDAVGELPEPLPDSTDSSREPDEETLSDDDQGDAQMNAAAEQATTLAMSQVAETTLKLTAATAECAALKATIVERDATIVELSAEKAKRNDEVLAAEVELAFTTWAERKGFDETQKPHMLSFRKSNPEGFASMFPLENPVHTRLLSTITPPEPRPVMIATDVDTSTETFEQTRDRLKAARPGMTLTAADNAAFKLRNT